MANETEALLDDTERYKKLQESAIIWSKKFSWDRSKKLSLQLIKEVGNINE